jgi:hypothetical protein
MSDSADRIGDAHGSVEARWVIPAGLSKKAALRVFDVGQSSYGRAACGRPNDQFRGEEDLLVLMPRVGRLVQEQLRCRASQLAPGLPHGCQGVPQRRPRR